MTSSSEAARIVPSASLSAWQSLLADRDESVFTMPSVDSYDVPVEEEEGIEYQPQSHPYPGFIAALQNGETRLRLRNRGRSGDAMERKERDARHHEAVLWWIQRRMQRVWTPDSVAEYEAYLALGDATKNLTSAYAKMRTVATRGKAPGRAEIAFSVKQFMRSLQAYANTVAPCRLGDTWITTMPLSATQVIRGVAPKMSLACLYGARLVALPEALFRLGAGVAPVTTIMCIDSTCIQRLHLSTFGGQYGLSWRNLTRLTLRNNTWLRLLDPDLFQERIFPNLASVNFNGCVSLEKLPGGLWELPSITTVNLEGCTGLKTLGLWRERLPLSFASRGPSASSYNEFLELFAVPAGHDDDANSTAATAAAEEHDLMRRAKNLRGSDVQDVPGILLVRSAEEQAKLNKERTTQARFVNIYIGGMGVFDHGSEAPVTARAHVRARHIVRELLILGDMAGRAKRQLILTTAPEPVPV